MVWALASWWGVRSARRVVVVGDGGDWIWNYSRDRLHFTLPDGRVVKPVEILDFYHAAENLGKAREEIFADGESPPAKVWFDRWRQRLPQGEVDTVIEELDKRAKVAKDGTLRDALRGAPELFRGASRTDALSGIRDSGTADRLGGDRGDVQESGQGADGWSGDALGCGGRH